MIHYDTIIPYIILIYINKDNWIYNYTIVQDVLWIKRQTLPSKNATAACFFSPRIKLLAKIEKPSAVDDIEGQGET